VIQAAVRPLLIIALPPPLDHPPRFLKADKPVPMQTFISPSRIEALDVGVRDRLTWVDAPQRHLIAPCPGVEPLAGELRAVVPSEAQATAWHPPLYFPEAERYGHNSRAEWFTQLLLLTPCPAAVLASSKPEFVERASKISGRKVAKHRLLADFYEAARPSIALPVDQPSQAVAMFRVVLEEYSGLCRRRRQLEPQVRQRLAGHADFKRLQTIPGIGPILALIILAESGDLRRFSHQRKFLKYGGLDRCATQSGQSGGQPKRSKRGNARRRYAFWMAGAVALRRRQNSVRRQSEDDIRRDPLKGEVKRKAPTAVAAKMARVVYGVIKSGGDYRRFEAAVVPGGRIPSLGP
jgi:Transposase IS116/IS110/IS902 family